MLLKTYNFDETALFWQLLPEHSLGFIGVGQKHFGIKKQRARVSILVGANADGSDKVPLLMIGKFKNPRVFKNVAALPVKYVNNKNAWMTAEIFMEFMRKLDIRFQREGRHVAVIMDNCSSHPAAEMNEFTNVNVFFLPPGTTSHTQPMDAGVIKNLKVHYRHRLCRKRLACAEEKLPFHWTILDAAVTIKAAWHDVKGNTIQHCFEKVGFVSVDSDVQENESNEDTDIYKHFGNIWERLAKLGIGHQVHTLHIKRFHFN
jgi:hypothetical protein